MNILTIFSNVPVSAILILILNFTELLLELQEKYSTITYVFYISTKMYHIYECVYVQNQCG